MTIGIEYAIEPYDFGKVSVVVLEGAIGLYSLDFGGPVISFNSPNTNRAAIVAGILSALKSLSVPTLINAYVDAWNDRRIVIEFDGPVIVPVSNNAARLYVQADATAPEPPPAPFSPRILDPEETPLATVWATVENDLGLLVPATLPSVPYTRRPTVDWGTSAHRSYVFERLEASLDSSRGVDLHNEHERFVIRLAFKRFIARPTEWIRIARAEAMSIKLWLNSRLSEQWPEGVLFARCLGYEIDAEREEIIFACDALTQEEGMIT